MFSEVKTKVKEQFDLMCKGQTHLYTVNPDRDKIWELYLEGFEETVRQGHNCNCCKSFLRQYGGIVVIKNNQLCSVWDIEVGEEYAQSIKNVREYIKSLPVKDVFLNPFAGLGTDRNTVQTENGPVVWTHFHVTLPKEFIYRGSDSIESKQGQFRDNKTVLKRSLDELTIDATETVLELVAQNSLYRGAEFKGMLDEFLKIQKEYKNVPLKEKDNYCWVKSATVSQALSRIRNTSIGTLLIDLSTGKDLDEAVSAFERVVAPSNYKRPNAIVTPRMVEEAKKRLLEMGFMDSLERRFANQGDVNINNILFTDKVNPMTDVFAEMSKDVTVNPKTLSKTEEITIGDFIKNVLPTTKGLEVLVENSHLNNFVSLLTAVNKDSKSMFKWNNQFSWSYTGGITDSIKERVKQAGGRVDGELRVSLSWSNYDDLDIHVIEPDGNHIYYGSKGRKHQSSAMLDVDMNAYGGHSRTPVENVIWTDKRSIPDGEYTVYVNNFCKRESSNIGFTVEIECAGEVFNFDFNKNPGDKANTNVVTFHYSKTKGITIQGGTDGKVLTKEKWGLKTNQFVKVKSLMLSPNYWENQTGNKHFLFFLDNCVSDESPRPFFNEFLTEELMKEKRVFETMAGKLKVEHALPQLSGIGFSETQPNHLFVRVEGNFKRTLKVNF